MVDTSRTASGAQQRQLVSDPRINRSSFLRSMQHQAGCMPLPQTWPCNTCSQQARLATAKLWMCTKFEPHNLGTIATLLCTPTPPSKATSFYFIAFAGASSGSTWSTSMALPLRFVAIADILVAVVLSYCRAVVALCSCRFIERNCPVA